MDTEILILIVVVVGIAYLFFGKKALFGLVALVLVFLKGRGATTKQSVATIEGEINAHEEQVDIHLAESAKETNEAKESQQEAADIAESITVPGHEVKAGRTRKSFEFK